MTHRIEPIRITEALTGRTLDTYCAECGHLLETMPRSYRHLAPVSPRFTADARSTPVANDPTPEQRPAAAIKEASPVTKQLPVNASSESIARRIAFDAAAKLPPKGFALDIGELIDIERPARPFDRVALQEQNVPATDLATFVFEATTRRVVS